MSEDNKKEFNQSSENKKKGFIDTIISYDKNELFNKILLGIMSILSLNIIYILIVSYSAYKLEKNDGINLFSSTSKAFSVLKKLAGGFTFQQFILFLFIINLVLIFIKLNKVKKFKKIEFILPSISCIVLLISNLGFRKFIKAIKILSKGIDGLGELYNYLPYFSNTDLEKEGNGLGIILIISLLLLVISIVVLFTYLKNNKSATIVEDVDIDELKNQAKETYNKAKEVSKESFEKAKEASKDSLDIAKKEFSDVKEQAKPYKKPIIIAISLLLVFFIGGFIVTKVKDSMTPDAVIDTSDIKIKLKVNGVNKYGVARAYSNGFPEIKDIKNKEKEDEIYDVIYDYKVELNKKKGIKNGDKVTAIIKFKNPKNLKLKYDRDVIKKSISVKGLVDMVNSYNNLPKRTKERMDEKGMLLIKNEYIGNNIKDVEFSKVKAYEKKQKDKDIEDVSNYLFNKAGKFSVCYIYKVNYKEKEFFSDEFTDKEKFECVQFYDFINKNKVVSFENEIDNSEIDYADNLEDIDVKLRVKDYSLIK